jgi:hypothetical protein
LLRSARNDGEIKKLRLVEPPTRHLHEDPSFERRIFQGNYVTKPIHTAIIPNGKYRKINFALQGLEIWWIPQRLTRDRRIDALDQPSQHTPASHLDEVADAAPDHLPR